MNVTTKTEKASRSQEPWILQCNVIGYSNWLWNLSHYSQYSVTEILLVLVKLLDSGSAVFRDSCLFQRKIL